MCGIAGIFHSEGQRPADIACVEAMTDALQHRGPDGEGVWHAPGVGLGHRRLAIMDPDGSAQPMISRSGRLAVVFNGEIYNYRELRYELAGLGHQFGRDGDTEVLLAAWEEWGLSCLSRLNGMFAFGMYDRGRQSLFLVRDRLGVKPLFMAPLADGSVIFASELKALLTHPQLERRLDPLAVDDFMAWGFVPDHRSILKGVHKLPAGHFLCLQHGSSMPAPTRWWGVSFANRHGGAKAEIAEELEERVGLAVGSRMRADVPLGAFLSGGVDSSSVVALMRKVSTDPVKTFTIGFDNPAFDEAPYADQVAKLYQTDHTIERLMLEGGLSESDEGAALGAAELHLAAHANTIARIYDEPFGDPSALPTLAVCKLARKGVKVALSGDGADEVFAGYRRHVFHHHEDRIRAKLPAFTRRHIVGPLGQLYPAGQYLPQVLRAKSVLQSMATCSEQAYAKALAVSSLTQRESLYAHAFLSEIGGYRAETELIDSMKRAEARTALDRAQYADLTFALPAGILTKIDRASMAVGLEVREPMLDYRLVEFGAALPDNLRVYANQGKFLLKAAMQKNFPTGFLQRKKQGFITPLSHWFRCADRAKLEQLMSASLLCQAGWFSGGFQRKLLRDHQAGIADNSRQLWQLLTLDASLRFLGITV